MSFILPNLHMNNLSNNKSINIMKQLVDDPSLSFVARNAKT